MDPCPGGRVLVNDVDHYKIKTVSSRFQDKNIYNYIYGNSSDIDCMSFELKDNGDIHITEEDGCVIKLIRGGNDS